VRLEGRVCDRENSISMGYYQKSMNSKNSKTILIFNLVLRKDETLTKHYKLYFKALKDSINQRANKIIVDYLLWFRWVDNSVKEKKQWEIQSNCTSMRNVITDTRIFFRTVYGKMLWSDEENIENIEKALVYKMYFLKEYVGVQQKDKLIVSKDMNIIRGQNRLNGLTKNKSEKNGSENFYQFCAFQNSQNFRLRR